ncbi:MAG: glycerol-3-phosphate dehydrogenase [Bacteroidia bacterium]|jgi:glycerol-3-phosphate dehydrogenase
MFSHLNRPIQLAELSDKEFDLLVVGGGITGVGIALDAVSRGLTVALLEKQDFGAGTSSRSTKLIHGGLRYLKQFDFDLVREVGRERAIVYRNAPHLVWPEKMVLPIIEGGSLGKFSTSLALKFYEWLAAVPKDDERVMYSAAETRIEEPLLKAENLIGSAIYTEYRTDDARLVIEVAKTAVTKGAILLNYANVDDFILDDNNRVAGVEFSDLTTGDNGKVRAKYVVNAGGPWVDKLRSKVGGLDGKRLHLTKGVHIVFDRESLSLKHSAYFDAGDGRMVFAVTRGASTYVGTTDTNYEGKLERPRVLKTEVDYLLMAVNKQFNINELTIKDVRSSWAGLRPLIHEDGKSPTELSRKDEIFESETGLISIAGGKLTGYRMMASRTVNLVCSKFENEKTRNAKCTTEKLMLSGSAFNNGDVSELAGSFESAGLDKKTMMELAKRYGSNLSVVLDYYERNNSASKEDALLLAELEYCVEHEMVAELSDFLIRRTGRLYFSKASVNTKLERLNDHLAEMLKLDYTSKAKSLKDCRQEFDAVLQFD